MVVFRVGSPDATFMETEFMPRFIPEDIINLPKFNIYLKLLIDGVTSMPFSAITLPPIAQVTNSKEKVIKISRERYAAPRDEIEDKILLWSGMGEKNIEEAYKESAIRKKANSGKGGGKPRHEYNCTRCDTDIVLPVELDRSRPIYCDDCITIVREEKKKGGRKPSVVKPALKPAPKPAPKVESKVEPKESASKPAGTESPAQKETEVVEKPLAEETVSLDSLKKEPKKEPVKEAPSQSGAYTCSDCGASFDAAVKLDRSRPMFCEKCLEKIREERKKGDKNRKDFKKSEPRVERKAEKKPEERKAPETKSSSEPYKKKRKRKRKKPSTAIPRPVESLKPEVKKEEPKPAPKKDDTGTLKSGQTIRFD